ncbi:MAG: biopolymer transporter ExbD, partial [Lautropia mirabilis]|nr:biopolymer transporter ExbD [Lautropia mirabilis]
MAFASFDSKNSNTPMGEINMVPLIDVMLVLLVIFIVTAPFVPTSTIDLPAVDATPRQPEPYIEVQVAADGKLTLQTRNQPKPQEIQVTRERLPDELKQLLTQWVGNLSELMDSSASYSESLDGFVERIEGVSDIDDLAQVLG